MLNTVPGINITAVDKYTDRLSKLNVQSVYLSTAVIYIPGTVFNILLCN
jgi:hypothetical protein